METPGNQNTSNLNIETPNLLTPTEYIKLIMNNIENNLGEKYTSIALDKYISLYNEKFFFKLLTKLTIISKPSAKYNISKLKSGNNNRFVTLFIYCILFILETKKSKFKNLKSKIFDCYISLLSNFYFLHIINDNDLLLIIKFIVYSSLYERLDPQTKIENLTKNKLIQKYSRLQNSLLIIIKINTFSITDEYLNFLEKNILKYKPNVCLIFEKIDILPLIYLTDKKERIFNFLSEYYSFKYNKNFLDIFIGKINEIYHNNSNNTIKLLEILNKNIALLKKMQINEDKIYQKDPYTLSRGFILNRNANTGLQVKGVILKDEFTIIFSFNYSPEEPVIKIENETKGNQKPHKPKIPIINITTDKCMKSEGFSFYIEENHLIHKIFNSKETINMGEIKENLTYIIIYSIKEYSYYFINIKSGQLNEGRIFEKRPYKYTIKNKYNVQIGYTGNNKTNRFEGYIGPVIAFNSIFSDDDEFRKNVFGLRGWYENINYFNYYETKFLDKYSMTMNSFPNDINKEQTLNYKKCLNSLKNIPDIAEQKFLCISPVYKGSLLNKKDYLPNIKIKDIINDSKIVYNVWLQAGMYSKYFFENKYTPFEFIKYEGVNYLILVFELIIANVDYMKTEDDKIIILNIFAETVMFTTDLVNLFNIENYEVDIRHLLFAIEKCINKICKKIKMCGELGCVLYKWMESLTISDEKILKNLNEMEYYIKIRNEIAIFLLDIKLYDLKDFSVMEFFFKALANILIKNPTGLMNLDIFKKIVSFSSFYNNILVSDENKIKRSRQFKTCKTEYIKLLQTFLTNSQKIQLLAPYTYLAKLFPDEILYNYRKYQFLKMFYLLSEFYFNNINKESYIKSWAYFIDLYIYFQTAENLGDIDKKQANIIMAICIRIIIEYPIVSDIFKENKKEKKKIFKQKHKKMTSLNYKYNEDYSTFDINSKINNIKLERRYTTSNNSIKKKKGQILRLETIKNNPVFYKIRSSSHSKVFKYKIKKYDITVTNIENIKKPKNKTPKTNTESMRKISIELPGYQNTTDYDKYIEFVSYDTLIKVLLNKSNKFNDYVFKALVLLTLESNNEVSISQEIKLKFITKVKKYDDLSDKDYKNFLTLKYFNDEVKKQFSNLIEFLKKYENNLTHVSYDIIMYLIMNISENRENNKCVFKHVINSRKFSRRFFIIALNNKDVCDLLRTKFIEFIGNVLPYNKKPFILDFLFYTVTNTNKDLHEFGQILINYMLVNLNQDKKINYHIIINTLILLYRITKYQATSSSIYDLDLSELGLIFLFDENLIKTKFNIFKYYQDINKNKCYSEVLYEVMLYLCIQTKKDKYYSTLCKLFIANITRFKKGSEESKSIMYYIDEIKNCGEKTNPVLKEFQKNEPIETPCLCLQLLLKTLKILYTNQEESVKNWLIPFISAFYTDSFLMFQKHSSKKKKYKNKEMYNFLYEYIKKFVYEKKAPNINAEHLINNFNKKYEEYNKLKISRPHGPKKSIFIKYKKLLPDFIKSSDDRSASFSLSNPNKFDEDDSNDSFSSCDSSKDDRNICELNQKKKIIQIKKQNNSYLKDIIKQCEKGYDPFDLDIDDDYLSSNESNNINTQNNINNKNLYSFKIKTNPFVLQKIRTFKEVILFPKPYLLEQIFGIYFTERLFYNLPFIKMMSYFKYYVKKVHNKEISINNFFKYPIIMKNYISSNLYFGGLFLKHDLNFFIDRYFNISHEYFIDKKLNSIRKRIFPKISDQDDITKFIIDKNEKKFISFYVDLVTNRNVVFGKMIVGENVIFFENRDKTKFLSEEENINNVDWLLGSQEVDYSNRNKKIYIFKKEITEIINRRFLYLFQACELYLKNGKSYFFNFYTEKNKEKFFNLLSHKNSYNIKIISDLKTDFEKSGFTKKWLDNSISTLEYLLFINKYSCRSYNDVNQYPVFPWLILYGNRERDLKYTTAAQTENDRMVLKEKFPFSSQNFLYHYTTHYSNASFLIYYLIRINPFTDNQITLQVNKFDAPGRQFNSIDEIQKILYTTKQPREVIPEFFMSTEFFYNYNCNFYGVRPDKGIINDLINKENFNSPVEYVLNNEYLLESERFKKRINYFFDNIFGIKQIGECEDYNRYNKYSYQDKINLKQKIITFKQKGLSYIEIKNKINSKANKIISFGQTPYRLFEKSHPTWKPQKIDQDDIANIDEHEITFIKELVNFDFSKNVNDKKKTLYALIRVSSNNYQLYFYDIKMSLRKDYNLITIQKKIKLAPKFLLKDQLSKTHIFKYDQKLIMIDYNLTYFIFCRVSDYCFCVINKNGDVKSYLTDSFLTCISKGPKNNFLVGNINGQIADYTFTDNNNGNNCDLSLIDVKFYRNFIAHKGNVTGIYYSDLLELIISVGDDKKIFIRKYYDLSLLTLINIDKFKICVDVKVNHNYLYMLFFDDEIKSHVVEVYSVNGLVLSRSKGEKLINNIELDKDGNLLIGYVRENKIEVYDPSLNKKITEIELSNWVLRNKKKKKGKQKEIKIAKTNLFLSFRYLKDNSCIYCHYSEGTILQKYFNISEKGNNDGNEETNK